MQTDTNNLQDEMTLEEGFKKLDEITAKMEDSQLSLEERFVLYKEGVNLIKFCSEKIDTVEKQLKLVNDDLSVKEV